MSFQTKARVAAIIRENGLGSSQLNSAVHSIVTIQRWQILKVVTHVMGLELTLWLLKKPDGCSCKEAGWCPRWNKSVSPNTFQLCQKREDYRQLWERERRPKELGDVVRDVLHWMGFKAKGCKCPGRQRMLNLWWRYWVRAIYGQFQDATEKKK